MPWIVSIDLSANPGTISLFESDGTGARAYRLVEEVAMSGAMKHSEEFFGSLDALLAPSRIQATDVHQWWVNEGPGSFTGLRIALAAVKGIAAARTEPIQLFLVNGAHARAHSWWLQNQHSSVGLVKVCTVSTATRLLCHTYRVEWPGASLSLVGFEMVNALPESSHDTVVLSDTPGNEGAVYWPSLSSRLLVNATRTQDPESGIRVLATKEAINAAAPVYYAAREFVKSVKPVLTDDGGTSTLPEPPRTMPAAQRSCSPAGLPAV